MLDNKVGLQDLADMLPIMTWLADADGEIHFVNRATVEATGVPAAQLVGKAWFQQVHPDDRDVTFARWMDAVRSGSSLEVRFRMRHRDGHYRWVLDRAEPRRDSEGTLYWFGSTVDIHEQVVLAQKASSLAARLEDTLETISDGFLILDKNGLVIFANEAGAQLLGKRREECLASPLVALVPAELAGEFAEAVAAAHCTGSPCSHTLFLPNVGLWCEVCYSLHGEGVAISLRDVTEMRRTQELQAMEAQVLAMAVGSDPLEGALEAVALGIEQVMPGAIASILLLDDDGIHIRCGAAPHLPESYTQAIEGQPIGPCAGSCGNAMYLRTTVVVSDIATDPLWEDYRDLALSHDLRACWSMPLLDGEGRVLGSFAIYYREPRAPAADDLALASRVCHLVALTIQSHRQGLALRESEARFRQIDAAMNDVFWMEDIASNRLIYLSPSFEEMLGFPRRQFDDRPDTWAELIHPDDRDWVHQAVVEAHSTWEFPSEGLRYRMVRANGEVLWVNDRAFLIRDSEGKPWRLTGVIRDITSQLALESQLRRSQRMESIGQLTGGIAHDFNNLLTVIVGNAETLSSRLHDRPDLLPLVQVLGDAAQRGADLTQRLLAFARRQPLEPRVVSIPDLVDDMKPLLTRTLGQQIHIHTDCPADTWPAMVDPTQLESALLNLCLNARDAMPNGGVLAIEASNVWIDQNDEPNGGELPSGFYVQLTVSDTGKGIGAADLERIFEPFYTTKETGKGTGLGLAMVYGFARQSQGSVSVQSRLGQGATFHLYLPRAKSLEEPAGEATPPVVDTHSKGERILMVEDDSLVRNFVSAQLQDLGYRVTIAVDGQQALEILRSGEPFDLLFTDVMMPGGLSGPELAKIAAEMRPDLRVLFTSGYAENTIIQQGRLNPGVLLLSKPYRREELAYKVGLALELPPVAG